MDAQDPVTVKISSEAAGYLSLSQVVVQQMPLFELVEVILGVTGKNRERVCEVLRRGVLVAGASRFRWQGWDADPESTRRLLDNFPDSEPSRKFRADCCLRAVLGGARSSIEILRETGQERALLRRRSYWDALMDLARAVGPRYVEYSHQAKSDCYRIQLSEENAALLRDAARRLRYSALKARLAASSVEWVDLYTTR